MVALLPPHEPPAKLEVQLDIDICCWGIQGAKYSLSIELVSKKWEELFNNDVLVQC